jgi:hypothetical protein
MANPHIKTHTATLTMRVPPEFKAVLHQRAKEAGFKHVSKYIASLVAQDAQRPDLLPPREDQQQEVLDLVISA